MKATKQISDDVRREIEVRAYLIWEREGRPHGCEKDHWARAEAEILSPVKGATPAKKTIPANAKTALAKAAMAAKAVVATKTKKVAKPKSPKSR